MRNESATRERRTVTKVTLRQGLLVIVLLLAFNASAAEPILVNGITEPFLDVTLSAPVSGIISAEFAREGDVVKKGDVILELDKKLQELELQRRKAVFDQAKMEVESTRALVTTTRSVSKEESAKKEAEFNVATAEQGVAAEELARRQLVAPFSGNIAEILRQPGAACAPYEPLVRLVDTSRCYFVGHMEGKAVSALRLDQKVNLEIEGAATPVTARVSFVSPVVDPASGLAKVKAIFENPEGKIRPGVAAKLTLATDTAAGDGR